MINFIKENEIYILISLNTDENNKEIQYMIESKNNKTKIKKLVIDDKTMLWDIFRFVKKYAKKEKIKEPKIVMVGYDLINIFNKFEDKKSILKKDKGSCMLPMQFKKFKITTNSHNQKYYKYEVQCRFDDVAPLLAKKTKLKDLINNEENEIEILQKFIENWFILLEEINKKFETNFDRLPPSCGYVGERVVNKLMSEQPNNQLFQNAKNDRWDLLRKGYFFDSKINYKNKNIRNIKYISGATEPFNFAKEAYFGGHASNYVYGMVDDSLLVDIDLKAAYNVSGHLIPDFMPGLPWQVVNDCNFRDLKELTNTINGPFTIGFLDCDVVYPSKKEIILTPYRTIEGTKYMRKNVHAKLTYTDAYNAYHNGATVYVHTAYFPQQAQLSMNESKNEYISKLSPYGQAQEFFLEKRQQNKDNVVLNKMYKLLGNSIYGKSAQGITNDNNLSLISNPYISAQYTSITKLLLSYNIETLLRHYQGEAKLLTVTTDGFLMSFDKDHNKEEIKNYLQKEIEGSGYKLWQYVSYNFFDGIYFEIKHKTISDVMVVRANFTISENEVISAMSGIRGEASIAFKGFKNKKHAVALEYKDQSIATSEVNFETKFNRKLIKFHQGKNGVGYFDTAPFKDIKERDKYKKLADKIVKNYNIYDNRYGEAFIKTMKEFMTKKGSEVTTYQVGTENYKKLNYMRYMVRLEQHPQKFVGNYFQVYTDEEILENRIRLYNQCFNRFYKNFNSFNKQYNKTIDNVEYNLIDFLAVAEFEYKYFIKPKENLPNPFEEIYEKKNVY